MGASEKDSRLIFSSYARALKAENESTKAKMAKRVQTERSIKDSGFTRSYLAVHTPLGRFHFNSKA
jgi:hypothetical protein